MLNVRPVLVVGGGITGTERAGDIAAHRTKAQKPGKVTLHAGKHLRPEMNEQAGVKAKQQLEVNGVAIILNDRCATCDGGKTYKLDLSGETIEAQEVIMTTGNVPANHFFTEGGLGSCIDRAPAC